MRRDPKFMVADDVLREVRRQEGLWGAERTQPDWGPDVFVDLEHTCTAASAQLCVEGAAEHGGVVPWPLILNEEVWEAYEEAEAGRLEHLRTELMQVAAVCVSWILDLDRRAEADRRAT